MACLTRLMIMRFSTKYLLSLLLIITTGCSAAEGVYDLTPTPAAAPGQPGDLVVTEHDAINFGSKLMEEKGGIQWIDAPTPVLVKEMSYVEAVNLIGEQIAQNDLWPGDTRVWLVVFKGRWQLIPLDPNQANPQPLTYEGCGFSLFTARNGELIAMGDFVCPAN